MSKCDLTFELERATGRYRPGDALRGSLIVSVDEPCKCDGLEITFGWQTHGRGNRAKGPVETERLGPYEWQAGATHRFPFEFKLPNGPVSYHGTLINVDWYLRARADVPWAIDPKSEQEVLLEPAPAESSAAPAYRGAPVVAARPHDLGGPAVRVDPRVLIVPMVLVVAFFAYFLWPFVDAEGRVDWIKLFVAGLFGFFLARMGYSQWRNSIAKRKLGDVRVELVPAAASKGQSVHVKLTVCPAKRVTLNSVTLELLGEEVATSGSGTKARTYRHRLHQQLVPISSEPREIGPGEAASFEARLELPPDAPATFRATDNNVRWNVIAHVDIPRWPDLHQEHELVVYPS